MAVAEFNRIIDIDIYDSKGNLKIGIKTPAHGRKPSIEINGQYTGASYIPAFNLRIKNLYLDLTGEDRYATVQVRAGYFGNMVTFTGQIVSLGIEEPGPEGTTLIQCQCGNVGSWLTTNTNTVYDAGTPMSTILEDTAKALNLRLSATQRIKSFSIPEKLEFNGTINESIIKLRKAYATQGDLVVNNSDGWLYCYDMSSEDAKYVPEAAKTEVVPFLRSPPQQNVAGEGGGGYTEFAAPWLPGLTPGKYVRFPVWSYIKYFAKANTQIKQATMRVTKLQFQFSTTGASNQMTVGGIIIGGM